MPPSLLRGLLDRLVAVHEILQPVWIVSSNFDQLIRRQFREAQEVAELAGIERLGAGAPGALCVDRVEPALDAFVLLDLFGPHFDWRNRLIYLKLLTLVHGIKEYCPERDYRIFDMYGPSSL